MQKTLTEAENKQEMNAEKLLMLKLAFMSALRLMVPAVLSPVMRSVLMALPMLRPDEALWFVNEAREAITTAKRKRKYIPVDCQECLWQITGQGV